MKKIAMIFAAMAAAFSFASCEKAEVVTENTFDAEKVIINVADPSGDPATKAVKTTWQAGDVINIWFTDSYRAFPEFKIRYDGSRWKLDDRYNQPGSDILMELLFDDESTRKKLLFFYESNNDVNFFHEPTYESNYREASIYFYSTQISNQALLRVPLVCSSKYGSNKNTGEMDEEGYLHLNLIEWSYQTDFHVVVTGLSSSSAANYALEVTGSSYAVPSAYSKLNVRFNNSQSTVCPAGGSQNCSVGWPNADGVAFYSMLMGTTTSPTSFTFRLVDARTSTPNSKTYIGSPYTATINSLEMSKMNAFRINKSKFNL